MRDHLLYNIRPFFALHFSIFSPLIFFLLLMISIFIYDREFPIQAYIFYERFVDVTVTLEELFASTKLIFFKVSFWIYLGGLIIELKYWDFM